MFRDSNNLVIILVIIRQVNEVNWRRYY